MHDITIHALYPAVPQQIAPFFAEAVYPWEILPRIGAMIQSLIEAGLPDYTEVEPGVWIGADVKIAKTATIEPPAIIGPGTEIRPGAYLRGKVLVGAGCVLGNSSELKNCILMDHVQVPHYNYVGDSILGNFAHMGAGSICSNLKSGGGNITIHDGDTHYETGMRKIGALLGDHADIGCGSVLNPGTVVGCGTRVYPLTAVRGVIPAGKIVKSMEEIVDLCVES